MATALAYIFSQVASISFHPVVAASPAFMYRMLWDEETPKLAEGKLAGDNFTARRRGIEQSAPTDMTARNLDLANRIAGEALRSVTMKVGMARGAKRVGVRLTVIEAGNAKA